MTTVNANPTLTCTQKRYSIDISFEKLVVYHNLPCLWEATLTNGKLRENTFKPLNDKSHRLAGWYHRLQKSELRFVDGRHLAPVNREFIQLFLLHARHGAWFLPSTIFPKWCCNRNHLKQCLTCELIFWDHYHPTLSYTLTIKPCLRCSGGPQENRRLKACKAQQEGSMRLHCPRNTQNFTKEIFKKLRECLLFLPTQSFSPKIMGKHPRKFHVAPKKW